LTPQIDVDAILVAMRKYKMKILQAIDGAEN
jgi:hypothetical protein